MAAPCAVCSAPILRATTTAGRAIIVDADPTPDGDLLFDRGRVLRLTPADRPVGNPARYRGHSCSDGAS